MKKFWNNKIFRVGLISIVIIIVGAAAFLGYYRLSRVQGTIESYTINGNLKDEENALQAIIYTQKRDFKNDVINELKEDLVEENIYVQVEPIQEIGKNKIKDWDKVVILSTIQSSNPPEKVLDYINQHKNDPKLSIYLTADSSKWSKDPGGLNVTTAASKSENINVFSEKISKFLLN